jgi:rRNA maturation endonuclease Nob1
MSLDPHILKDDETFVEGRSEEKAQELLKRAAVFGLERRVSTTFDGYIVPTKILAEAEADEAKADPETPAEEEAVTEFDPSKATVEEVQSYLDGADDAERERVLAAEAKGKDRKALRPATHEGDK